MTDDIRVIATPNRGTVSYILLFPAQRKEREIEGERVIPVRSCTETSFYNKITQMDICGEKGRPKKTTEKISKSDLSLKLKGYLLIYVTVPSTWMLLKQKYRVASSLKDLSSGVCGRNYKVNRLFDHAEPMSAIQKAACPI